MVNNKKPKRDSPEQITKQYQDLVRLRLAEKNPDSFATKKIIPQVVTDDDSFDDDYYGDSDEVESEKNFKDKINIFKKEVVESKYWVEMVTVTIPQMKEEAKKIWGKTDELNEFFNDVVKKIKDKGK